MGGDGMGKIIEVEHLSRTFRIGEMTVPALRDVTLEIERGFRGDHGAVGLGQIDADEYTGLPG